MQGGSIEVKADLYDSLMNRVRHKVVNTAIANDLHMSADGYKILGERFAAEAMKLIRNND